jgi:hypothetical protein
MEFGEYCAEAGVQGQLTVPYSPQQHGVVERRNQTVVGMAQSMMKAKGLPGMFWGEAMNTAVYILNRSPTRSLDGKTLRGVARRTPSGELLPYFWLHCSCQEHEAPPEET